MTSYADSVIQVRQRLTALEDLNLLTDPDIQLAVGRAVQRYSKDRPRMVVASFPGNSTRYYKISDVMQSWVRGFSVVEGVNYPSAEVVANGDPNWLPTTSFTIYLDATDTEYLYFSDRSPVPAETVRVYHTGLHIHTDAKDTVYANDLGPLRDMAAGFCCVFLATHFSQSQASTINQDIVEHQNKQLRYKNMADYWFGLYDQQMGGVSVEKAGVGGRGEGPAAAASETMQWTRRRPDNSEWYAHPTWRR